MRKLIDIPDNIMPDLAKLSMKEKRNNKTDIKNFVQSLICEYVSKNK